MHSNCNDIGPAPAGGEFTYTQHGGGDTVLTSIASETAKRFAEKRERPTAARPFPGQSLLSAVSFIAHIALQFLAVPAPPCRSP